MCSTHFVVCTNFVCSVAYVRGSLFLLHSNSVEVLHIRSDSFTKVTSSAPGVEFDSSSLSPGAHCHSASLAVSKPQLLAVAGVSLCSSADEGAVGDGVAESCTLGTGTVSGIHSTASILVSSEAADGRQCDVLKLTGSFPADDLSLTWSSLPSAISAEENSPS